jgi:hypothetical protein
MSRIAVSNTGIFFMGLSNSFNQIEAARNEKTQNISHPQKIIEITPNNSNILSKFYSAEKELLSPFFIFDMFQLDKSNQKKKTNKKFLYIFLFL